MSEVTTRIVSPETIAMSGCPTADDLIQEHAGIKEKYQALKIEEDQTRMRRVELLRQVAGDFMFSENHPFQFFSQGGRFYQIANTEKAEIKELEHVEL